MPPATASANFLHICSILSVRPIVTPQGTPLHVYTLRLSEGAREPASDINHMSQLQPEIASARRADLFLLRCQLRATRPLDDLALTPAISTPAFTRATARAKNGGPTCLPTLALASESGAPI